VSAVDSSAGTPLLAGIGLERRYALKRGAFAGGAGGPVVHAVAGIDIAVQTGETLALVGESGCGKSTAARCLTLLERPDAGEVRFRGETVTGRRARRDLRRAVQLVFQDPYASLNPRQTVGAIVAEPLVVHRVGNRPARADRVAALLAAVGLSTADAGRYPHAFSGGQRQRIAIARALALDPDLIVADEPLSALDVSIQSQILNLMADLKDRRGLAYLFISHDLAVVDQVADRVAVMYLGRIVEEAPRRTLFEAPRHPYTQALMAAAPKLGAGKRQPGRAPRGEPADPSAPPAGCAFHPRCPLAQDICRRVPPPFEPVRDSLAHRAACHFKDDGLVATYLDRDAQIPGPIPSGGRVS